jgi:UDP-GlcNAc:undecaprenyl-phosphate GlcNAc-1-phosphate transferase
MLIQDILIILGFTFCAIIFSVITNSLLLKFSHNLGIRNTNDVLIRWSNQSKPSLGGISFFAVFVFSAVAYSILFSTDNIFEDKKYVGLFVSGCLAFVMGLADDAYNTKPIPKLIAQILCGLLLFFTGFAIELSEVYWINGIVTVVWVVGVMNSINMLEIIWMVLRGLLFCLFYSPASHRALSCFILLLLFGQSLYFVQ